MQVSGKTGYMDTAHRQGSALDGRFECRRSQTGGGEDEGYDRIRRAGQENGTIHRIHTYLSRPSAKLEGFDLVEGDSRRRSNLYERCFQHRSELVCEYQLTE